MADEQRDEITIMRDAQECARERAEIEKAVRADCARLAMAEMNYWAGLDGSVPEIEIGAVGAAANICGAIAMGNTAADWKRQCAGRAEKGMETNDLGEKLVRISAALRELERESALTVRLITTAFGTASAAEAWRSKHGDRTDLETETLVRRSKALAAVIEEWAAVMSQRRYR